MTVLHALIYLSLLIFLAAVIARIVRIAKMPVHLRWELYPLPHEKGKAAYGGSILEEVDWWTKPREKDSIGEIRFMIPEILFLKGIWDHNRPLWFPSWTLHFGLYLLIGALGLLITAGILTITGVTGGILALIFGIVTVFVWTGCVLGVVGSVLMLLRRLRDRKLKMFNTAGHFFNLLLLGAIYLTGLIWVATDANYAAHLGEWVAGCLSVSALPVLPAVGYWNIGFVLLFLIYFPFTHMTHAFVKYFTWHAVRWEDEPNLPGGKLSKKVADLVNQPVSWAASHVHADGKTTWVDLVSSRDADKEEKKV